MLCGNCGKENVSFALYCYNCGIRLNQDTDLAEPHLLVDSGSYPEEITENAVCAENQQKGVVLKIKTNPIYLFSIVFSIIAVISYVLASSAIKTDPFLYRYLMIIAQVAVFFLFLFITANILVNRKNAKNIDSGIIGLLRKRLSPLCAILLSLTIVGFIVTTMYPRGVFELRSVTAKEEVVAGESFSVEVEVANIGKAEGIYNLLLVINGKEENMQTINVAAEDVAKATFNMTEDYPPGLYDINIALGPAKIVDEENQKQIRILKPAEFYIENFNLSPTEIQIDQETTVSANIVNKGEVEGDYNLNLLFDGETVFAKKISLSGNSSENISYKLSKEEPGQYPVVLNEQSKTLKVLKPAETKVSNLTLSATSVKPGQTVTVTVKIENSGEVAGEHTVALTVGGKAEQSKVITVKGNSSEQVSFDISRESAGRYTVDCDGFSETLTVVKIERPANGSIISRSMGSGQGVLTIKNGRSQDALVVLTGVNSPGSPLLAVYVRANNTTTVRNIADRIYDVYFTHGNDWEKYSKQFTADVSHMKFRDSLSFSTTSTQYTIYEITVHSVPEGTAAIDYVSPDQFPRF
jgi:plastocyanin